MLIVNLTIIIINRLLGAMGSPLTVTLAEIRVTDVELRAIASSIRKPKNYYHFVDDGFGHFIDREHAEEFLEHLNSMVPDLEYTIEHPSPHSVRTGMFNGIFQIRCHRV